jgi:hypothetical protein
VCSKWLKAQDFKNLRFTTIRMDTKTDESLNSVEMKE